MRIRVFTKKYLARKFFAAVAGLVSIHITFGLALAQQQPAGVVTGIQGQAQLTRPAVVPSPLKFKDGVIIRDVVDTREKSLARILFGGRSTVTVRELSRLQVTEEILPTGARRDVHDLSSGAILVNVARQLMKPGDEVIIRTPNAVAAVRGSTIFASFNAVLNQSFFALLSGSGLVTPQGQTTVNLTPNTGVNVTGTGPTAQVNQVTVTQAQANQILAESQVGKVVKEEANKEQNVQAAAKEAAALAQAVVESVTKTEQTTGETKTEEQKKEEQKQEQQEQSTGETTTETTAAPVTADTSSAADNPDTQISGTKNLTAAETPLETKSGKSFEGSGSRSGTTPVVEVTDAKVTQASGDTDSLIVSKSGSDWSLSGPLLKIQNSEINNVTSPSGSGLVEVMGKLTSSAESAFITIDPSTVKTKDDLIHIGTGGSLGSTASPLKSNLLTVTGTAANPTKLSAGGDFVEITGGGALTSNATVPLLKFDNSEVTVGADNAETHFFRVTGSTSKASLAGPLVSGLDSKFTIKGSAALEVVNSGKIESTTTSPFVDLSGGSLTFGSNASGLFMNSSGIIDIKGGLFKAKDTTITAGSGVPFARILGASSLTAGGSFFDLTNVNLDLGDPTVAGTDQPLVRVEGGSTLKNTAGPVIKISGGSLKADALANSDGAGNKFELTGILLDLSNNANVTLRTLGEDPTSSTDTTKFTLAANEPFIKMANSTLKLTGTTDNVLLELDPDDVGATFNGVGLIATDSTLTLPDGLFDIEGIISSTSTQPLLQLTNTTVTNTDDLIAVDFVTGGTDVTLAGQLVKSSGSTWKVNNRDKNTVQTNIALGAQPIDSIAVISDRGSSGDLNRAYVPIPGSDTVKVINTDNNTVVATITVGDNPVTVGATKNGDRVVVLNSGSSTASIINTHTNTVVATVNVGSSPEEVGFSAHNDRAFVINQGSNNVSVIDLNTNSVIATVSVGTAPVGGAVSQTGGNAYVTNSGSNNVSVIDTDTGAIIATVSVGTKPVGAALTPDEKKLYVVNETSNNVSVIDTATNAVVATIAVGTKPHTGAITSDGKKGYVVNEGSNNVSVIDTSNDTVTKTISVGTSPSDIAITRDGRRAYVANEGSNNVSVIDTSNDTVIATISVGTSPSVLGLTPNGLQLFVVNESSNNLSSINTVEAGDFFEISGGAKLTGNSTSPFLEFNPSEVTTGGTLVRVTGTGSSLTLASPLLKATDTKFTIDRGVLRVEDGGSLKSTSTSALIQLTGTAADKSIVNTVYPFVRVEGAAAKLTLDGPFLTATKTDFSIGTVEDPANFLFFIEGAAIKSTSTNPFVTFDGSKLKRSTRFLDLRRTDSSSVAASLELAGPLLEAKNSSSFTTDRDFIGVSEKATLKGTGTGALLQFTGSSNITTTGNLGNADFFRIDDSTGESAQGPASVDLAGPLVSDSGGTFDIADRFLNVRDGATLKSTSSSPLIDLSGTTLSTERDLVQIDGSGSKITLSGSLLSAGSTLNIGDESDVSANMLNIHSGGQLVLTSTSSPVIEFTGGTHTVGTADSTTNNTSNRIVRLVGVNTDSTTGLGTDQPIKGPASTALTGANNPIGTLLKATDAATIEVKKGSGDTSGGNAVRIDTALYEATLPILDLVGSSTTETTLKTAEATIDIFKSKIVSQGPVVALDKSFINVTNGAFINLTGGTEWKVTGDLLKLINGAKIEVINGPLILVSGTSSSGSSPPQSLLDVSGALVNFGGSGNNKIIVNNTLCSGACATKGGSGVQAIQVKEGSTGSITIGSNPIKNSSLGTITYQGSNTALIQTGSSGKVNITAPAP